MYDDFPHHVGGVIQVRHTARWGAVPESLLEDVQLDLDSRAVAAWLAIKPEGWKISVLALRSRLARAGQKMLGKDRWQRIALELESAGYLTRKKLNGAGGQWVWHITFNPTPSTVAGFPGHGIPTSGSAAPGPAGDGQAGHKVIPKQDPPINKTTTTDDDGGTEKIDDLVEAATWAAKRVGQIRNEPGFRHRVRTRILSTSATPEDLQTLAAWRAHCAQQMAVATATCLKKESTKERTPGLGREHLAGSLAILKKGS